MSGAASLWLMLLVACCCSNRGLHCRESRPSSRPNFILFVGDDVGFGDLSSYGHPTQEWGAIDDLAREGVRFTQCYSTAALCTPSRASIMTGRLPARTGMVGPALVHFPGHDGGLPHSELTVAEALRDLGYTTGMAGKWHLGNNMHRHDDGAFLPQTQGFQHVEHFLPGTLSMACDSAQKICYDKTIPSWSFLYHNTTLVQQPLHLENLTATLVQDAKAFVYDHADQPFFYYMSFPQAHTPMFNDHRFKGKSRRGVYGDQMNEMAWGVSEILDTVNKLDLDRDTLTMFVSDHGPHLEMCQHGGDPGPFKGGKLNMYEGGVRVPAIVRWPGKISPGRTSSALISLMDIFTTFVDLAGGLPPQDRHIDGKSLREVLLGTNSAPPVHDILYLYCSLGSGRDLDAVRYQQYKIYFRVMSMPSADELAQKCDEGAPLADLMLNPCSRAKPVHPPLIYDVEHDPRENYALSAEKHAHVLQRVEALIAEQDRTMHDLPEPILTWEKRHSHLIPCCRPPYCVCNYPIK